MLTKKQHDLLAFIHRRTQRDGVPPSFDEMKEALDLRSKSGIHRLITALEERGFIRRLAHRARAIEVVRLPENMMERPRRGFTPKVVEGARGAAPEPLRPPPAEATDVPLVGRIAAGLPIEAIERADSRIAAPASMLSAGADHFALEVRGDSMVDAGIFNGDTVVIRKQNTAQTGDIVVALIEDHEATLKRLKRQTGGRIALEAENPAYETRIYREDQVRIQGRLVGLIRSY